MRRVGFPSVCTTDVIVGLGHTDNADYEARSASNVHPSVEAKLAYVVDAMKGKGYSGAMLTAITTNQQQDACKIFKALGWRSGPWTKSRAHPDTRTKLWFWCSHDPQPTPDEVAEIRKKLLGNNS